MNDYRVSPNNLNAEKSVLGSILLNSQALAAIGELHQSDFYHPYNAKIYETMQSLSDNGTPIDFVTVSTALADNLDEVGGYEYLAELSNFVPSTANVGYYAAIVRETSKRRNIIKAAEQMAERAYQGEDEANGLAEQSIRQLVQIAATGSATQNRSIGQVTADTYAYLEKVHAGEVKPMLTGMTAFDSMTGGFHKGELTVLGARPGVGKSAWAMHVADKLAKQGFKVLFFSREMADLQYGMRALSRESGISSAIMRNGKLQGKQWESVAEGTMRLYRVPLYINNTASKPSQIAQACREMRIKTGLDLVVVDYLQLLEPDGKHGNREQEVASTARALKMLTTEGYAVLALSQLKRPPSGTNSRPSMQDLRESGALEQDADNVMLQHMPDEQPSLHMGVRHIELILAKQRMGDIGTLRLAFKPAQMQYTELQRESV